MAGVTQFWLKWSNFLGEMSDIVDPQAEESNSPRSLRTHCLRLQDRWDSSLQRGSVSSNCQSWQWDSWRWWRCYQTASDEDFFSVIIYASFACFISFTVTLVKFVGFFSTGGIVNRDNGLEVVALLSNCIGWRRLSEYYNDLTIWVLQWWGDYRTIASRSLQ